VRAELAVDLDEALQDCDQAIDVALAAERAADARIDDEVKRVGLPEAPGAMTRS
jgi:hypothetical protein